MWNWLRITAAVQAEQRSHTSARFGADLTLADIVPLEFRGGGVISHNPSPEGRTSNGGYIGGRLRLPSLTIDGEGDFTQQLFNARGYVAGNVDGWYFSAGGDSLDRLVHVSLGVEDPGNLGLFAEGGVHLLENVQYGTIFVPFSSRLNRHEFDLRMSKAIGNGLAHVVGRGTNQGFSTQAIGIPLLSPLARFEEHENIRDLIGLSTDDLALMLRFRNDGSDEFTSLRFPNPNGSARTDVGVAVYYTLPHDVSGIRTDGITVGADGSYSYVQEGERRGSQGEIGLELLIPFIRPGEDFALSISGRGFLDPSSPKNGGGSVLLDGRWIGY